MIYRQIEYTKTSGRATIIKDNPDATPSSRGGIFEGTLEEIADAFDDACRDPDVAAIVLTTPDGVLHHGSIMSGDLFPDGSFDPIDYMQVIGAGQRLGALTEALEKPVIGVAKTGALGGGLEHLLACDFIIAAEDASFSFPEVRFGMTVGWGASWRLPRAIGWTRAKELLVLGDTIDGREAARIGLVTRAVPTERVDDEVNAIVAKLGLCSPTGVAFTKHSMAKSWSAMQSGGIGPDWEASALGASSQDFNEALAAMREQRPPRFRPLRRLLARH